MSSILSWMGKTDIESLNGFVRNKWFFIPAKVQLYMNSKICCIIAADGFAERLEKFNVTSIPVRPVCGAYTRIFQESVINTFDAIMTFILITLFTEASDNFNPLAVIIYL